MDPLDVERKPRLVMLMAESAIAGANKTVGPLSRAEPPRAKGAKRLAKVDGAARPLYSALFMEINKHAPADRLLSETVAARRDTVEAAKGRGKGAVPVSAAGRKYLAGEATAPMRASRGGASFLGEPSIGHADPGVRSAALTIAAVDDAFGEI
jgi:phosphoenolpyruvate---glycerone phosphotransferase subunit DhaL